MRQGYLLKLGRNDYVELSKHSHERITTQTIHESLERVTLNNQLIDGTKIQDDWFPEVDASVFISHSGKDEELAMNLANFLNNEYGVKSFVDSQVWGYFPNLMIKLDNGRDTENKLVNLSQYDKCSTHVHNMLSIALSKMIQKCDYFIFLDTQNSRNSLTNMTESPWIYFELSISHILMPKEEVITEGLEYFSNIAYKAPTNHLKQITFNDLSTIFENDKLIVDAQKHFQHLTDYLNHR